MIFLPNILTTCNITLGLTAVFYAQQGRWIVSAWLVIASTLFDGLDGKVAKWLKAESPFGKAFDSWADLISFGLAPASIFYFSRDSQESVFFWLTAFLYFFCAAFRLIRFHGEPAFPRNLERRNYFRGLPTTASAGFFASFMILFGRDPNMALRSLYLMVVLSALMVSDIRFLNPKYARLNPRTARRLLPFILGLLLIGILANPAGVPFFCFSFYILSGLLTQHAPLKNSLEKYLDLEIEA